MVVGPDGLFTWARYGTLSPHDPGETSMSETDGSTDPYRTPDAPGAITPGGYPPLAGPDGYAGADPADRPAAVGRLRQVMLAGAVAAVLQGGYAVVVVDDLLAVSAPDLEQVAADAGLDAGRFNELAGSVTIGVVILSTLVAAGLWLLFARLFDRGSARGPGTVLGGINGASLLVGLLAPTDLLEWVLTAVSAALVVAGLVLLWRPTTTAWFRAAAAARARPWG